MQASKLLFSVLLIFCLTACTKGSKDSTSSEDRPRSLCSANNKISNGRECSTPSSSPVVMLALADLNGELTGLCSGTLITPWYVLTAAHCIDRQLGIADVYVDASGEYDFILAEEKKIHPAWIRFAGHPNDIGIIRLQKPITTRATASILLSRLIEEGDMVDTYGYGLDESDNAGILKRGQMKISNIDRAGNLIAEYNDTGMSICSGDSGGPAAAMGDTGIGVIGVNSAGSAEGCKEDSLALFVTIQEGSNLDFVTEAVPQARVR